MGNPLEDMLTDFRSALHARNVEPDPFHILNITKTEAPYTHFLGWILDPTAPHPWNYDFLVAVLEHFEQPIPPAGTITFFIESFGFTKKPDDPVGFTHPDIVALAPDIHSPTWCLLIENKFDSKEGRASDKATQCATYAQRAKERFGRIDFALLFATRNGLAAADDCGFASASYRAIAGIVENVSNQLRRDARWPPNSGNVADLFSCYLVDSFVRHVKLHCPDPEVSAAMNLIRRGGRPKGVRDSWLRENGDLVDSLNKAHRLLDRWSLDAMIQRLRDVGAVPGEVAALEAIFQWGEDSYTCDFQASKSPSVVVRIPTCGSDVVIVTVQERKLRFYWGLFIGGYDDTRKPNRASRKFPHAYELANRYCNMLNDAFGWELKVLKSEGGFYEPARPLSDISDPKLLERFLQILSTIAAEAADPEWIPPTSNPPVSI